MTVPAGPVSLVYDGGEQLVTGWHFLRSMALLAQPDRSVLEVSITVGFDDAGAFARSFARHCGETPSAYKRRISRTPS
jgi:AraC-like DNA-binding protein